MNKLFITKEVKVPFKFKRSFIRGLKTLVNLHDIEGHTEVNLIITNNKGIQKISKEYKKKDKPTDVLSFSTGFKELKQIIGYNMLGDIYISYDKVKQQALTYGHSEKREWVYLFIHGLLHLIGYNHINKDEEIEMNKHARKIMEIIKVGR